MTPDSVHLLTRSSQMTLCKDEQGRVRRAYYGPRLHQPEDALENAADAPLLYSSLADSVTGLPNASGEYCICVTQADGALSLSLECQGWEVLELDDDREEAVFWEGQVPTLCGWKSTCALTGNRTPFCSGRLFGTKGKKASACTALRPHNWVCAQNGTSSPASAVPGAASP